MRSEGSVHKKGIVIEKNLLLFIFAINTVLHGKHAFTLNYLYDTDDVLYFRESTLNWLEIGRQGAFLQKEYLGCCGIIHILRV